MPIEDTLCAPALRARERGMTPGQVALAWVLARQPSLVPVVGAKTRAQLEDVLGALERPLSKDDLVALESVVKISGDRYDPNQMKHLDSERR
ncbi:aldo/keto reductase [Cystobacter fuscus]|nr:aldo/keto reductase [Cystobacter fuscus]